MFTLFKQAIFIKNSIRLLDKFGYKSKNQGLKFQALIFKNKLIIG
jgi:hypothetical protein